jgi:hypothetical protein
MKQWAAPDCGTLRISNPNTLQRWIDDGRYQQQLDDGYIFAPYCGRFRTEQCTCSACRRKVIKRNEIIEIINQLNK